MDIMVSQNMNAYKGKGQKKGRKSKVKGGGNENIVLKEENKEQRIPTMFRGVSQAF